METISQRIAKFTSKLRWDDLPSHVKEKSKVTLLHNLGMAMAGIPLATTAQSYANNLKEQGVNASARLLINGLSATPDTAALANAALMHARAQDDVYFQGLTHSGSVMTPAALAIAESLNASGQDVLVALVVGSEACAAICEGYGVESAKRGFRPTGVFGVFASTVAVARLLKLDADCTAHAISIAASCGSGVAQPWVASSQEWQFQIGMASRNGILAARLAAAGVTGASDALEGSAGFYRAFAGSTDGSEKVATELGRVWRSLDVTYKPFPVCAILQAPVTRAIELAVKNDLKVNEISSVRLYLNPTEAAIPGTDSEGPYHATGATLMSAQFCLSVALSKRTVQGADLQRYNDTELLSLIKRTKVIADASLGTRSFKLQIDQRDGSSITHVEDNIGESFNWTAEETIANLKRISSELPFDKVEFSQFVDTIMNAENVSAKTLVDVCLQQHRVA